MVACAWEGWAEHLALALATQSVPSIRILVNTAPPSGSKWKRRHDLVPAGVPLASVPRGTKKERREGPPPTSPKEQVTPDIEGVEWTEVEAGGRRGGTPGFDLDPSLGGLPLFSPSLQGEGGGERK